MNLELLNTHAAIRFEAIKPMHTYEIEHDLDDARFPSPFPTLSGASGLILILRLSLGAHMYASGLQLL